MKELFLSYMQKYPTWIRLFGLLKKNMMEEYRKMLSLVLKNIQKIKNYIFFYYLCKCIGNNLQALGDIRFLVVNCFHLMILTYWKQLPPLPMWNATGCELLSFNDIDVLETT